MLLTSLVLLANAGLALGAGRPKDVSICDYYTTALLKKNTAANQMTLLTLVVNTAEIGNYTQPNVGIAVPGILNPNGLYKKHPVNLLPYFDGTLMSTNVNGKASHQNFLDGGGAAALMKNMPAFDKKSNQYFLLTHLYEFFGLLLGCSKVGSKGYPAYGGDPNMYNVHKFMDLDHIQIAYFIEQVGLSAASFGVADADVKIVGDALTKLFNYKCSPPAAVVPAAGPVTQSICVAEGCPFDKMAMCSKYPTKLGTSKPPKPVGMATLPSGAKLPAPPKGANCPIKLGKSFIQPKLIVPMSTKNPKKAYGPSKMAQITPTTWSIFDFDFPSSFKGKTCNLVFSLPKTSQLKSGSYKFGGPGFIEFAQLEKPATAKTTYATRPPVKALIAKDKLVAGEAYTLATYPCPDSGSVGIRARSAGTSLSYTQSDKGCPIGLFIMAS